MRTKPSLVYFSNVCDRRNTKRMKTLHILQQVALMSKQDFLIGMFFRLSPPRSSSQVCTRSLLVLLQRNYIDLSLPQFSNPSSLKIMYSHSKRQNDSDFQISIQHDNIGSYQNILTVILSITTYRFFQQTCIMQEGEKLIIMWR